MIKALTIHQPYAHLICTGEKLVENRSWPTRYRGPLAIHAGKSRQWLREGDDPQFFVYGAIVAVAHLIRCEHITAIETRPLLPEWQWLKGHKHTIGPWCWVLENVQVLSEPVVMAGRQGLWDVVAP